MIERKWVLLLQENDFERVGKTMTKCHLATVCSREFAKILIWCQRSIQRTAISWMLLPEPLAWWSNLVEFSRKHV
jgi:hypothetical protein